MEFGRIFPQTIPQQFTPMNVGLNVDKFLCFPYHRCTKLATRI